MQSKFKVGNQKTFQKVVTPSDTATFESGQVHNVLATFALARDAEWACRLFVLDMKDEGEEGIGTFVSVNHLAPAKVGETVTFTATLTKLEKNLVECIYQAQVGDRLIAEGTQQQKILKKDKLKMILGS